MDSEKRLEKLLNKEVKQLGGLSIKLFPFLLMGLPDRLCLFKGGVVEFVELKSEGKKPTKAQTLMHRRLSKLGFSVSVIDNRADLLKLLNKYG